MIAAARPGSAGWQTMLADLALILFLVAASALDRPQAAVPPPALPPHGEPVAIWREGADAPPLTHWLVAEQRDPRLQLTLLASPAAGPRALQLAADHPGARVVVDPSAQRHAGIVAMLAYDRAP
ncbi:hypothetical protein V5740_02175 [Croceibacterium sp. TMG7-5b_MA50]|uniref:hypothetical protein n=1 Tax=Croceibacterium sp. TMG7-5b_MA50 TaxID=3121290 RepID=UPI003221CAF4